MSRAFCLFVVALIAGAAHAGPRQRAALMVVSPPGPTGEQLEAARRDLGSRYTLESRTELRRLLEGFGATPTAEARVKDALERARRRMRQLDLAGVGAALDEAEAAASSLPPTPEDRALFAQVFLRRAATALAARDQRAATHAVGIALGAAPELTLDPADASPPMVQLVDSERARRAREPRVAIELRSSGGPAQISIAGVTRGASPLRVGDLPRGPVVVWWTREGHAPKVSWAEAQEGATLSARLTVLDSVAVVAPLVEALRRADARTRPDAARALASALGVDVIALAGADPQAPTGVVEIARAPGLELEDARLTDRPASARKRPWYKKGWVWGVVAGSVLAAGGAVALGLVFGLPSSNGMTTPPPGGGTAITCCR